MSPHAEPPPGRHVLVTGAAGGIGAAVCAAFAEEGCTVTASDLPSAALTGLVARLGEYGGTARALPADLADAEAAAALVGRAADLAGPPDVLVNAAGIYPAVPLAEMTAALWDRVQDVNVRAAMLTSAALARLLTAAGTPGAIVNITSGAALRARFGAAHYSASKAALEMLTRSCAVEFGPHGIRVNAVSPGFVTVDSAVNPVTEEYAAAVSVNPLGRPGEPADIARAVRWVAGPEASWMTGSVVRLDGGASAGTTTLPRHWPGLSGTQAGADREQAVS
ncbi:SDR family oxidoreductase [Streptomyces sp. NPDC047002]|uniref:SDR family NAD(P)-dependent oxidoreductase n=1 Tax=Streptomyces sp. NPDC047002 TaxID=3155475 RepID=UPI0034523672